MKLKLKELREALKGLDEIRALSENPTNEKLKIKSNVIRAGHVIESLITEIEQQVENMNIEVKIAL